MGNKREQFNNSEEYFNQILERVSTEINQIPWVGIFRSEESIEELLPYLDAKITTDKGILEPYRNGGSYSDGILRCAKGVRAKVVKEVPREITLKGVGLIWNSCVGYWDRIQKKELIESINGKKEIVQSKDEKFRALVTGTPEFRWLAMVNALDYFYAELVSKKDNHLGISMELFKEGFIPWGFCKSKKGGNERYVIDIPVIKSTGKYSLFRYTEPKLSPESLLASV